VNILFGFGGLFSALFVVSLMQHWGDKITGGFIIAATILFAIGILVGSSKGQSK
jgi:hypothetical protein